MWANSLASLSLCFLISGMKDTMFPKSFQFCALQCLVSLELAPICCLIHSFPWTDGSLLCFCSLMRRLLNDT